MAEKDQQGYPLAPVSVMPRSDEESAAYESMELKKKKRMKCFAYIALFAVFQIIVILVFALVVMRVKTPKVRLANVAAHNIGNGNIRLTALVRVRNTNFGHYKFESSVATLRSELGETVGQFVISDGRARARSTKRIYVIVDLNIPGSGSNSTGVFRLSSEAKLRGKVEFMKVLKRKKSAEMSCTMSISWTSNVVQDLMCK